MQLHEGHRMRMRQRALVGGLQSLAPHEVIELILFYAVPRRDVNGVAHELIDKFGSVGGVLSASKTDLMSVRGVGEHAADLFTALNNCVSSYSRLPHTARRRLGTRKKLLEYINARHIDDKPHIILTLINNGGDVVYTVSLPAESGDLCECLGKYALERALKYNAAYVVAVYKGMKTMPQITAAECDRLREMSETLAAVEVIVLDYIIITDKEAYSLRHLLEADKALAEVSENAAVSESWLEEPDGVLDIYNSDN